MLHKPAATAAQSVPATQFHPVAASSAGNPVASNSNAPFEKQTANYSAQQGTAETAEAAVAATEADAPAVQSQLDAPTASSSKQAANDAQDAFLALITGPSSTLVVLGGNSSNQHLQRLVLLTQHSRCKHTCCQSGRQARMSRIPLNLHQVRRHFPDCMHSWSDMILWAQHMGVEGRHMIIMFPELHGTYSCPAASVWTLEGRVNAFAAVCCG